MNSFRIYEVDLCDIKVSEDHSKNEALAKEREGYIKEYGPVNMMVLSASMELLLHPEIYYALLAGGATKAEAVVVTTAEDANQHVKNLFGMVPGTCAGKADWLERNQLYYKKGGAGFFLRLDESKDEDDKSLKKYLSAFIGLSHGSVQKLLDISRSESGAALLHAIDEGKSSIDKAYKICHSAKPEKKALKSLKDHSCVTVLGGNTKGLKLSDEEKSRLATMFAGVTKEVSEQLSLPEVPAAFNLRPNTDRKGKLESYSLTYKSATLNFTGIIQPKGKEVQNETK